MIMAKDPICNMEVEEEKAEFVVHVHHETFYFCSERCKEEFEKEMGLIEPAKGIRIWSRFLKRLSNGADKDFGGKPPKCH